MGYDASTLYSQCYCTTRISPDYGQYRRGSHTEERPSSVQQYFRQYPILYAQVRGQSKKDCCGLLGWLHGCYDVIAVAVDSIPHGFSVGLYLNGDIPESTCEKLRITIKLFTVLLLNKAPPRLKSNFKVSI